MVSHRGRLDTSHVWWLPPVSLFTVLALLFAGAAVPYVRRYRMPFSETAGVYGCFLVLLLFAFAPGVRPVREFLAPRMAGARRLLPFVVIACAPYLAYGAGTGDFRLASLTRLAALALALPVLYTLFPVRRISAFSWQDACGAVLLIGTVLSGQMKGVWSVPANLDFMGRLFLIAVAAWCWTFVRPVPELNYEFRLSGQGLAAAVLNFLAFALIAIPLGLLIGFTSWNPEWRGAGAFLVNYLEIFLFVALLEETFFRGFLQTLLAGLLNRWWKAQLLVSCVFGLFHILHAPFPNWRYVILATISGWFYGSAFRQGSSVLASSLTHAAVDTVWRTFFTRA